MTRGKATPKRRISDLGVQKPRGPKPTDGKQSPGPVARGYQIQIACRGPSRDVSDRAIRRVMEHVLRRHGVRECDLEIVVLGLAGIERLNRQWLGHEGPTDAIAFDLGDGQAGRVVGQINVCRPVAAKQAARRGHAAQTELMLYMVHGLLHLLGYDDHDPKAASRMHRREDDLFEELGFGRVYSAGAGSDEGAT